VPRAVLAALPGAGPEAAAALEAELRAQRSEKEQRSRLRTFLLAAAGGQLAALTAADAGARAAAASVTVTRLGAPAERRARGGPGGFGSQQDMGAMGLAAFGAP
jgi:hypothetical protein